MNSLSSPLRGTNTDEVKVPLNQDIVNAIASADASFEQAVEELQNISDEAEFDERLALLDLRYPENPELWKLRVVRLNRRKDYPGAIALIEAREFDSSSDDDLALKAGLLHDARAYEAADAIFEQLVERSPQRRDIRTNYAKRLMTEGWLVRADEMIRPIADIFPEGTGRHALVVRMRALLDLLGKLEGAPLTADTDARVVAMKHAILRFRERSVPTAETPRLGRLSLITGSLGPGGAERQLTRLAVELERARLSAGELAGILLDRPVEVIVRSHGPEKQNDFYLGDIAAAGVELHQINYMTPLATRDLEIEDEVLEMLVDYLPPAVNFGVRRLSQHLRQSGCGTASMWQDGACLFAGLAALIAGVPHIQLAIRGLPPSMRRHMYRPEYEIFYRAMAEVPGVTFLSNSRSAAQAYADWLDVPIERFAIVYNGVEPMHAEPSDECAASWDRFLEATADAENTVGGVFRFDTDKQPLYWIRFAARYLKQHPRTRMVLVGGGRLLPNCEQLAEELGIADRILFVGRSNRVGYWMSKMDALVLLSRYEGLPNVLIEAQYMGVRVATTPAGGAPECLIDGVTGHVLDCAEKPDLDLMVDKVADLVARSNDCGLFAPGGFGRRFLDLHFSIPRMLAEFVTCTAPQLREDGARAETLPACRQAA